MIVLKRQDKGFWQEDFPFPSGPAMAKVLWKEASMPSLGPPDGITEPLLQMCEETDVGRGLFPWLLECPAALQPRLPLRDWGQCLVGFPAQLPAPLS